MTFHDALPPFVDSLFSTMGYTIMRLNDQHVIVHKGLERKVDIYRDNKKSWNILGPGVNVDVINQAAMAGLVINILEKK